MANNQKQKTPTAIILDILSEQLSKLESVESNDTSINCTLKTLEYEIKDTIRWINQYNKTN